MRLTSLIICCFGFAFAATSHAQEPSMKSIALVVHGGAGTIERSSMTPEREKEYRAGIQNALRAGERILRDGGSALDATEAAVRVLEDNPHFNAGKGAVFTSAGTNELDAAIMDGKTLAAGAVAGVQHVRNPVTLARAVMEKSKHVFLIGAGAEDFAKRNGIELVGAKYFFTQRRWDELKKEKEKVGGEKRIPAERHGTVGAVAQDQKGNLAAATSTGGTTNKLPGRVGDSPVIGAGTYADNTSCAVSGTGDGEYFIRAAVAHEVSTLMLERGMSLREASEKALARAQELGGTGGLIAVDKNGEIAVPFNTSGMYRGYLASDGKYVIDIYRER
jgi:L-asparaginase / beta-aspartyl-peptidase